MSYAYYMSFFINEITLMKALIIDDEDSSVNVLRRLMEGYCQEITKIWAAKTLVEGVALIKLEKPDIVFLDIELPDHFGTQIFSFLADLETNFQLIVVSGHEKYALSAFKIQATDYLLKPVQLDRLQLAVHKCKQRILQEKNQKEWKEIRNKELKQIAIETEKGIAFLAIDDILYFQKCGSQTKVFCVDSSIELLQKPLTYFTHKLKHLPHFFQYQHAFLINLQHAKLGSVQHGNTLIVNRDTNLPISIDNREQIKNRFDKMRKPDLL